MFKRKAVSLLFCHTTYLLGVRTVYLMIILLGVLTVYLMTHVRCPYCVFYDNTW